MKKTFTAYFIISDMKIFPLLNFLPFFLFHISANEVVHSPKIFSIPVFGLLKTHDPPVWLIDVLIRKVLIFSYDGNFIDETAEQKVKS